MEPRSCAPAWRQRERPRLWPSAVMRPSLSSQPSSPSSCTLPSTRARAADRETQRRRGRGRRIARDRAPARKDRRRGFRAGCRRRAKRSAVRPTAGTYAGLGAAGATARWSTAAREARTGFEPGQADIRLVARHRARPGSTTMRTPSWSAGLGDRGREHDLALPFGAGAMARSWTAASSAPKMRVDLLIRIMDPLTEKIPRAVDFGGTGGTPAPSGDRRAARWRLHGHLPLYRGIRQRPR